MKDKQHWSPEQKPPAAGAHRVQGLQRGCPLNADGGLWSACGAWRGRADSGGGGYTELFHAAGAAPFHQSTNTVKTNGGKEASQEELWPSIQLSAKGMSDIYLIDSTIK